MKVLAIETSCVRGSVALSTGTELCAYIERLAPDGHDAGLLGLIDSALRDAGWQASDLERLAVGIGPGSFTGVRVGIAVAQGIALGLGLDVVGISSLQGMALAVEACPGGLRCAVLDARKAELFVAIYDDRGREHTPPQLLPVAEFTTFVAALPAPTVVVGRAISDLGLVMPGLGGHRWSAEGELPSAKYTAVLAATPAAKAPLPDYVRGANAILPRLPRSPFAAPKGD